MGYLSIGGQVVEGGDVEPELFGLGELAHAGAEGDEVIRGHVPSLLHQLLRHVEHPLLVQPEAVGPIRSVN